MVAGGKTVAVGLGAVSMVSFFSGLAYYYPHLSSPSNELTDVLRAAEGGAVAGRVVSVPVKVYREAFKATLKLGQCPYVMEEGKIKTCADEFDGDVVHLAKGKTTVDVTKVQTSEDILLHIMGGLGASVGVLGLASVSVKYKVAVTTETTRKTLNMISSYEMNKGVITLHNPHVKRMEGEKALFLSEIELGGNEMLLVTLDFKSEKQKIEVEMSVKFKILFISITAKIKFIHETFSAEASCRIQFKSSWRKEQDIFVNSLDGCIPRVEEIENMYMQGPTELRNMATDDERSHYFYYFSSWKASPYGSQLNLALVNHDLEFLTEQNAEIQAVRYQIKTQLEKQSWPGDVRSQMLSLNSTLSDLNQRITTGIEKYHTLSPTERKKLRDIYGQDKAPQYYRRSLEKIITQ